MHLPTEGLHFTDWQLTEGAVVEATWWSVAVINGEAAEACTRGDWTHYVNLMRLREEIIERIKVEGKYEVFYS